MLSTTHHCAKYFAVLLSIFLCCLGSHSSLAEVYKSVDERGKVIFTDQPTPGAEKVEIKDPNTSKPVMTRNPQTSTDEEAEAEYGVTITSPEDDQLFPNRLSPFTVSTRVTPSLKEEHRLRLKIDGKTHSISVDNFTVGQLNQGEHTLVVEIIDADNTAIAQSPAITIFARNPG